MRINKYVAAATGMSRRAADRAIEAGRVRLKGQVATLGDNVQPADTVSLDGSKIGLKAAITIMLNKPVGYVCSRNGQGNKTIYDLLPDEYRELKPAGRLDKDSSGLLILTNDGGLAQQLTHPRYTKSKVYAVSLNKPLQPLHQQMITDFGVNLEDGISRFGLTKESEDASDWQVTMSEGRNRQIRRTFAVLGYNVEKLHRLSFGPYRLGHLASGQFEVL